MRKGMANVKARLSQVHWVLVLVTAVLIYIVTFLLGIALSFPMLAFLQGRHLDSQSAFQVSSFASAVLVIVVTGYGALKVARRVEQAPLLHGILVGLVVAMLSFVLDWLFRGEIQMLGVLLYVLMVIAGWLGGVTGSRRREQS
jgi:putative membrane protein (TIGR04086 family)